VRSACGATNKAWVSGRGIPWKRGWLCFGTPAPARRRSPAPSPRNSTCRCSSKPRRTRQLRADEGVGRDAGRAGPCVALNRGHRQRLRTAARNVAASPGRVVPLRAQERRATRQRGWRRTASVRARRSAVYRSIRWLNCLDGVSASEGVFHGHTTTYVSKVECGAGQAAALAATAPSSLSARAPVGIDKAVD